MDFENLEADRNEQRRFLQTAFENLSGESRDRVDLIFWDGGEWPSQKIIATLDGKRRYFPCGADIRKSLNDAADTLAFEVVIGRRF